MADFIATLNIHNNEFPDNSKDIEVPVMESEHWHVLPLGCKGDFLDIRFSVKTLFYIEIELTGE